MMKAETDEHYAYVAVAVEEHEALDESMRNAPKRSTTSYLPWVLGALALVGMVMISMPCHHHKMHDENTSAEAFTPEMYYDEPNKGGWYRHSSHDGPNHYDHHHHHHSHDGPDHHHHHGSHSHSHSHDGPHSHSHAHDGPHHGHSHSDRWEAGEEDSLDKLEPYDAMQRSHLRKSDSRSSKSSRSFSQDAARDSLLVPFLPPPPITLETQENYSGEFIPYTTSHLSEEENEEKPLPLVVQEGFEEDDDEGHLGAENEEEFVFEGEDFVSEEEWELSEAEAIEENVLFDYPEIMVTEALPAFEAGEAFILIEEEEDVDEREAEEEEP